MADRLTIREDTTLPPGWVAIGVTGLSADVPPRLSIRLSGQADQPNLGPDGWQSADHLFEAAQVRSVDGRQEWLFGPSVSHHLHVDMAVMLTVPDAGIKERHFWPEVSHGVGIAVPASTPPGQAVEDVPALRMAEPSPAPEPPPAAAPLAADAPAFADTPPAEPSTAQPAGLTDSAVPPPEPRAPKRSPIETRRRTVALALIMALLLAITGIFISFWSRPPEPQPQTAQTTDFAARYRLYLQQGDNVEPLYALGQEALAAGATSIGFEAITLSADRGGQPARLQLARWYDPTQRDHGPLTPSAGSAATYYRELGQRGDAGAASALSDLCRAATDPAMAGSEAFASFDPATFCPAEPRQ